VLRERIAIGGSHAVLALPSFDEVLVYYKKNWERALTHRL